MAYDTSMLMLSVFFFSFKEPTFSFMSSYMNIYIQTKIRISVRFTLTIKFVLTGEQVQPVTQLMLLIAFGRSIFHLNVSISFSNKMQQFYR